MSLSFPHSRREKLPVNCHCRPVFDHKSLRPPLNQEFSHGHFNLTYYIKEVTLLQYYTKLTWIIVSNHKLCSSDPWSLGVKAHAKCQQCCILLQRTDNFLFCLTANYSTLQAENKYSTTKKLITSIKCNTVNSLCEVDILEFRSSCFQKALICLADSSVTQKQVTFSQNAVPKIQQLPLWENRLCSVALLEC